MGSCLLRAVCLSREAVCQISGGDGGDGGDATTIISLAYYLMLFPVKSYPLGNV